MTLGGRLEELTSQLDGLTVEQDNINSRVVSTRREVAIVKARIAANITREAANNRTSAVTGSGYYVHDRVIIINPSKGQGNSGAVVGETRDGLLKIKPPSGKVIRRLPKNVRRDERDK